MTLVRLHTLPLINRLKIVFASSAATNLVKAFELLKRFFFFFHRNYPRTVFLLRAPSKRFYVIPCARLESTHNAINDSQQK